MTVTAGLTAPDLLDRSDCFAFVLHSNNATLTWWIRGHDVCNGSEDDECNVATASLLCPLLLAVTHIEDAAYYWSV